MPQLLPPDGVGGIIEELSWFIFIISLSSLLIFLLARSRRIPLLVAVFAFFVVFLSFTSSYTISYLLIEDQVISIFLSLLVILLWSLVFILKNDYLARALSSSLVLLTGSLAGIVFVIVVPIYVTIVFLVFLCIYDLFSVRYGHLKELMKALLVNEKLKKEEVTFSRITTKIRSPLFFITAYAGLMNVGIGDVMSYVMLNCIASLFSGVYGTSLVFISITLGFLLTYKLMIKLKLAYAPGLPLPILFGLITIGILRFL